MRPPTRIHVCLGVCLAVLACAAHVRADQIHIDFAQHRGKFKGLHQHFCGQGATLLEPERQHDQMRQIGASLFRIWLLQPPAFFKGHTLEDAANPAMYDFSYMDKFAARAEALGITLFPTLATTPPQLSADGKPSGPPKDIKLYCEIIRHVVLHLTRGWGDGHHYDIPYWEVWNEPDIVEVPGKLGGFFWTGTRDQYFELYAAVSRTIQSIEPPPGKPPYKVGGGGFMRLEFWGEQFVEFCDANDLPLDFFSFHHYSDDPADFIRLTEQAQQIVQKYPRYRDAELILNEWNMNTPFNEVDRKGKTPIQVIFSVLGHPKFHSPQAAIHMARSLILMERSPLSKAGHCSLADNGKSQLGVITYPDITFPPLLVPTDSPGPTAPPGQPKTKFHVLRAFEMLSETPRLVALHIDADQIDGLAGISASNDKTTAVFVNWGEDRYVTLNADNLFRDAAGARSAPFEWTSFVLNPHAGDTATLQPLESGRSDGSAAARSFQFPGQSIVVLRAVRFSADQ